MGQRRRAYVMVDDWRGMAKRLLNCGTFELFLGSAGAHDLQSAASLQARKRITRHEITRLIEIFASLIALRVLDSSVRFVTWKF